MSLPRLELSGPVLAGKLMKSTTLALTKLNITFSRVMAWTDSTIVLSRLVSYPGTWGCFVANRVSVFQEQDAPSQWKHVRSEQNPADCVSRGKTATDLLEFSQWWKGLNWLAHDETQWLNQPILPVAAPPERRKRAAGIFHLQPKSHRPVIEVDRFSNLDRLQRTTAYVMRFIGYLYGQDLGKKKTLFNNRSLS